MKKILTIILTIAAAAIVFVSCEEKVDDLLNPTLSLSPQSVSATAAAGNYTIAVKSNSVWVAAIENAVANGWCTVTGGATGIKDGQVTLSLEANAATVARTATLAVSAGTLTAKVTVTQAPPDIDPTTLSLQPASISAGKAADSYTITVTSNATWTAAVNAEAAEWCTLSPASGNNNGTVTVTLAVNPLLTSRAATITLTAGTQQKTVPLTQAAGDPALSVEQTDIAAEKIAGSYTIAVTSNTVWTAAVNSAATAWCTLVEATASGNGNGTVTVNVSANPLAAARTATVTLTAGTLNQKVTVTQAASDPTLSVNTTEIAATAAAGTYPVAVTSNTAWTVAVDGEAAAWCAPVPATASGNGTITVNVTANPTVEIRTATIMIAVGELAETVVVIQAPGNAALTVNRSTVSAAKTAGDYILTVTSNTAWSAAVNAEAAAWCTLTDAAATGNGTVTVHVTDNPAVAQRAATVTFSAGTLTQKVSITQAAGDPTLTIDPAILFATRTAGSYPVTVTSNTLWTAAVNAEATTWCTLSGAAANGNGTLTVNVAANPSAALRAATITVTAGALKRTVTVTQEASDAFLTTDVTEIAAAKVAGTYAINVTSNTQWTSAVNTAAAGWCTLANAAANGDGAIQVSVAANPTIVTRTATVTITAGALVRTVTVTQTAGDPTLSIDKTTIAAEKTAGNYPVNVTSNTLWTAAVNAEAADWCTLSNATATGNGTVNVVVAANPTVATRTATVTISIGTLIQTVVVTQAAGDPALSMDKTTISAAKTAGSYPVAVTCNTMWNVAVNTEAATWCTLSGAVANGNGTVTVHVTANPLLELRTATVTVTAGTTKQTVTVIQDIGDPTLSIANPTLPVDAVAGNYSITVNSNTAWNATVDAAATWCTLAATSGSGNGAISVNIAANLVTEARTATVTVTAAAYTQTAQATITQEPAPAPPTYAASNQVWYEPSTKQFWSDLINIPACDKSDFSGAYDCRSYTAGRTYYYYGWNYMMNNNTLLCPSPWRLPSIIDLGKHNQCYDGLGMSGYVSLENTLTDLNATGWLWSTSQIYTNNEQYADPSQACTNVITGFPKAYGVPVRCVK